jgi:hypothetical protein
MANGNAQAGVAAGRPQPQTTVESPGGPFIRHSQDGRRTMYTQTGVANGGLIANPMVASPGYNKGYRVKVTAVSGGASAATYGTDGLPAWASLVTLKDAFGTPIIVAPGFHAFYLIPLLSGQFGIDETQLIANLPSYASGSTTTGAGWTFSSYLPWEFAKAYGLISGANASLLPTLQINVAAIPSTTGALSAVTGTAPTFTFEVFADFYWLPQGVAVEPPGIGTTCQWVLQPCNPTISSGGTYPIQFPRLGGYLTTIIAELRESNGLRCTEGASDVGWPVEPRLLVDGVPLIDSDMQFVFDDMAIGMSIGSLNGTALQGLTVGSGTLGGGTANSQAGTAGTVQNQRPAGVAAFTRKTALQQRLMGLLETGETFLSTNPGTQIELAGYPWGTLTNGPATLNALVGQVVPSGQLIQGLPEV